MNKSSLELYLYMGNEEPIIKWLVSEGVKTSDEAKEHLDPIIRGNIATYLGHDGGTLYGTSMCLDKVYKYFGGSKSNKSLKKVENKKMKSGGETKPSKKKQNKSKIPYPKVMSIESNVEVDVMIVPEKKIHPSKRKPNTNTNTQVDKSLLIDHH